MAATLQAAERHMGADPIDYATLASEASTYATERHGCDENAISRGIRGWTSTGSIDEKDALRFGAWYAYIRSGLRERGYLND